MEFSKSQVQLMDRLKTRGPQSVKILAKQLDMTTMGVRQHLTNLAEKSCVDQTQKEKQTRGRPVHLWKLTKKGHEQFPDTHSQMTLELIDVLRTNFGDSTLNAVINHRNQKVKNDYAAHLKVAGGNLETKINSLADLRNEEGYLAEVRLVPDGWMLIENHCPIFAAAKSCQQFCQSELETFQELFDETAEVHRVDHVLAGARRCAFKIKPHS
ncbi:MAG TPA: transcriptional regulator [Porticoccaceae bacterium]|jgi:predicted ArsR family transcriptional regulator|nr:transcriptional regulator [Gammaproteobacteria bacterium]HIL60650.1 transcriptional regulator [Porticoccaceae bacterium]